jgi:hypothetical protein
MNTHNDSHHEIAVWETTPRIPAASILKRLKKFNYLDEELTPTHLTTVPVNASSDSSRTPTPYKLQYKLFIHTCL